MRSIKNNRTTIVHMHCRGFTLVEVMVVASIMAILAAIAYPSYQESIRKTKRSEAQAALMQLMQQQERYYSRNNSYIAFSSASEGENEKTFKWFSGDSAAKSAYEIKGAACANESIANCIVLTAKPGTNNVDKNFRDPQCGELTLNSVGEKTASTGATDCWR
jgi:type IV pilus assembly protein PilE